MYPILFSMKNSIDFLPSIHPILVAMYFPNFISYLPPLCMGVNSQIGMNYEPTPFAMSQSTSFFPGEISLKGNKII
jgi:hypothetical protein